MLSEKTTTLCKMLVIIKYKLWRKKIPEDSVRKKLSHLRLTAETIWHVGNLEIDRRSHS